MKSEKLKGMKLKNMKLNGMEPDSINFPGKPFREDEDGIGTVEMVLILVVLIGLVVIFRSSITSLLQTLFTKINGQALSV